jgi:YabP family
MKKVKELVTRTKDIQQSLLLNDEKITIINQGKIMIQNYQELLEIDEKKLTFKNLIITGKDLKILNISKYFVEIEGQILGLAFGFNHENI